MRRFLPILFLLCTSPAWATFTLVQHVTSTLTTSSTSTPITVSSTGSGHVIVVVFTVAGSGKALTGVAGGGTYTHCTSCSSNNTNGSSSDISYTLNSASGATTITPSYQVIGVAGKADIFEYSFSGASVAFDVGGNIQNTTNTLRGGVDLTALTGTNDLLIQAIATNSVINVTAISGAYTDATDLGSQFGFAAAKNTATGTAPTWTFSGNSQSAGTAIAISETSGGATVCKSCDMSQLIRPRLQ